MSDLLNIGLVDDSFKNILLALDNEPEEDHLEGLCHRQLEKSTSMQNAAVQYHIPIRFTKQCRRELLKVGSYGLRHMEGPPAKFSYRSITKKAAERQGNPSHYNEKRRRLKRRLQGMVIKKARAQEAQSVHPKGKGNAEKQQRASKPDKKTAYPQAKKCYKA